jgi:hypothetical protein
MNVQSLKKTLLIGSLTILISACQSQQIKPTKPALQINPQNDGGICLTRENAAKLGAYILELERQ